MNFIVSDFALDNAIHLLIMIPHETTENIASNPIIACTASDASVISDIIDICCSISPHLNF
jgi:hypothetical protein